MGSYEDHGNKISPSTPPHDNPEIRKLRAEDVPYGENITRHGGYVYAAYVPGTERRVCVCATAPEARRRYRELRIKERLESME